MAQRLMLKSRGAPPGCTPPCDATPILAISELPDQDCCTLLTPRRVETRAKIDDLRRIEIRLDAAELAEQLALTAQEYRPE